MKKLLIFFGGFAAGILATLFVLYVISLGISSNYSENEVQVQYIEVKGKKGNVILHTGMPKDSVKILVGKPDKVNLHTSGGYAFENWGYIINKTYGLHLPDLDIDFIDGKLKSVRQD